MPKEVEFFFYCKARKDAEELSSDLLKLGYEVYENELNNIRICVCGVAKVSFRKDEFFRWVEKMNELAFINNAEFDGWGTLYQNPGLG